MRRHCNHDWFKYPFLTYSKSTDGLFCFACVLFPMPAHQGSRAKQLISQPYKNWKDASTDLQSHTGKEYHHDSMEKMKSFVKIMERPVTRIDQCISTETSAKVERNRIFLSSVIRAVLCS